MESIWVETAKLPQFESLKKDIKVDTLIIGGGIAGILCAYMLEQTGVSYALVEAKRIGSGITQNTTAKITSQHGLIYSRLIKEFDVETARLYYESNEKALEQYRRLCSGIDCDFEERDSYVYSLHDKDKLQKEMKALEKIGGLQERKRVSLVERVALPLPTVGAVCFHNQAQFNPLKFLAAVSEGLHIYENTKITQLKKEKASGTHMAEAGRERIVAQNIVVATHFPFINKHGSYYMKLYQDRSYVIGIEPTTDWPKGMYVDEAEKGMSFRTYQDLLLIGGGAHRTGKQGGGWRELEAFRKLYYPHAPLKYHWAAQDCVTLDGIPYIGQYSTHTKGFYTATGFDKWGMTSAMTAGMLLRDLIIGKANPYERLYSPSRTMLRSQLWINGGESVKSILTFSKKRCPHLGCVLKWNEQEHTWDCPCHGSRFSEQGDLIDNPATDDLKKPE